MSNLASLLQSFRAFVAFRFSKEVKMTKRTSVFFSVVMLKSKITFKTHDFRVSSHGCTKTTKIHKIFTRFIEISELK